MLENLLKPTLAFLLNTLYRVQIRGLEHYRAAGDKVVIVANHQSFLDPMMLAVFIPDKPAFAMNVYQARKWYFAWVEKLFTIYKIDPLQPMSLKHLILDVRKGAKVVIFPEGRITTSGGIMKVYEGAGRIVEKTGAAILPVHIDGAQYSKFSRLGGKLRQRWFPQVTITFLPPKPFVEGKKISAQAMYDILTDAAFEAADYRRSLLAALLEAAKLHGNSQVIATDMSRDTMTYRQLFIRANILGGKLAARLAGQDYVGVMLPNALGAVVTFVTLHTLGKIPAMLNFSSGEGNILHACRIATVKTVLTSRAFIEKGKLEHIAAALEKECTVIYLEDLRAEITLADKLRGLAGALCMGETLRATIARTDAQKPAVVLYTSGSEGAPKGVALSHSNMLANIAQAFARLDLTPQDVLFNALPVFHSFGLTVGMWLPMLRGIQVFYYPSPVHYRVIPELVYDSNATIMLGTDTFFGGYARYAHPYDFGRVRLAVAGAEKLKDHTRQLYADMFRVNIMQGYGVTEASPLISFNTAIEAKVGTVGRCFPGMECRLEKIEGLERGGRLQVKGANVMLGYLKADKPGVIQPQGEWYDTGDIVDIDEDGFITILGRAKRFAKIGGEMVSLLVVEDLAASVLPDVAHAALAIPDDRKGEQIILYSESKDLTREMLLAAAREKGLPEIALPKQVLHIAEIPRLGTGKIDYPALGKLALQ